MSKLNVLAASAILALFILINIFTLKDGHNWGDDFAQYIHHAINLVEHKPYTSDISLDYWVCYPPGFPLLLSSVIYWFGINFKILKSLNVLLWALSALAVYGLALNRLGLIWARVLTVWFLSTPFFFFFKQNVLSDIPFMCFVLLSLWSFMKSEECEQKAQGQLSKTYLYLSIFCMSYSLLIRWSGISLFLAVALYFLVVKQDWKKLGGFALGLFVSCFVAIECGSSFSGYFIKTATSLKMWLGGCWFNILYNVEMLFSFIMPDDDKFLSKIMTPVAFELTTLILGLSLLYLAGLFIFRLSQRKVNFVECFILFYVMGAFLWPVRGGPRYLLPMVIPVTITVIQWIKPFFYKGVLFFFIILIFYNIFTIASDFKFNDDDIFQKESLEMIQWVGVHIKPGERYMFAKPRALGLLTQRAGAAYWVHPEERNTWFQRIRPLHIGYLIADRQHDYFSQFNNLRIQVNHEELNIKEVWENSRYKIFKVP